MADRAGRAPLRALRHDGARDRGRDFALALLTFATGAHGLIAGGMATGEAGEVTVWAFQDEQGEVGAYGAKLQQRGATPQEDAASDPAALQIAGHWAQLADLLETIAGARA